ncbi:MAG: magnesium/cobalt transporter CorA [Chloroflexota bacterium]|nr:MAG: magnesium and cobalt transport protein CorA [Chloroflexota bacterium]
MAIYQLSTPRATWINIVNPTPADVDSLRRAYPYIHPLNLEDVLSQLERPKIDDNDDYIFIVMHFPLWDENKRLSRPREVDFFVGRGYVITVHDGTLKPLNQLFRQCEENPEALHRLLGKGSSHAFYDILDKLVDYFFPMLRKVDGNIRAIEETIFAANARTLIRDIALVRRDIIALRRIIRQQVPILENLERKERPIIQEDLDEYFGDILDHLYKARDIIDEDYEIIAGLAETADTLITNRVNEVMRILTVISVIMLPLTLISSIYGMNISQLPFADHPQSFLIINGILLLIAIGMLAFFRYRHWL